MADHRSTQAGLVHAGVYLDQVLRAFEAQARIDRQTMHKEASTKGDYLKRLGVIRLKHRLNQEEFGDHADPYIIDWTDVFTPIEAQTWGDMRYFGLDYLPQYPIGRFYADFADPAEKIVIECDGEAFHRDQVKDVARDDFLRSQGWRVFRLKGRECMADKIDWNHVADLRESGFDEDAASYVDDWLFGSSEGFFYALAGVVYGRDRTRVQRDRLTLAVNARESLGSRKYILSAARASK